MHKNQKLDLDDAIKYVMKNPLIGTPKKGNLANIRVYKFKMTSQLTLLAYEFYKQSDTIVLLAIGSHENFYRDLK